MADPGNTNQKESGSKMKRLDIAGGLLRGALSAVAAAALCLCGTGCEDDGGGGGGGKIGEDNDLHTVLVVGDSISAGYGDCGAPWPSRLASMLGCNVINNSVCGIRAYEAGGKLASGLSAKPAFVLIYLGANDAINDGDDNNVYGALSAQISAAQDAGSAVYVANLTPMTGSHTLFDGARRRLNGVISSVAGDTGASLVNLAGAFGNGDGLLQHDGLHPNDPGQQKIAEAFYSKLKGRVK